jgi:hypothetical protein
MVTPDEDVRILIGLGDQEVNGGGAWSPRLAGSLLFFGFVGGTTLAPSLAHPGGLSRIAYPVSLVDSAGCSGVRAADLSQASRS